MGLVFIFRSFCLDICMVFEFMTLGRLAASSVTVVCGGAGGMRIDDS